MNLLLQRSGTNNEAVVRSESQGLSLYRKSHYLPLERNTFHVQTEANSIWYSGILLRTRESNPTITYKYETSSSPFSGDEPWGDSSMSPALTPLTRCQQFSYSPAVWSPQKPALICVREAKEEQELRWSEQGPHLSSRSRRRIEVKVPNYTIYFKVRFYNLDTNWPEDTGVETCNSVT